LAAREAAPKASLALGSALQSQNPGGPSGKGQPFDGILKDTIDVRVKQVKSELYLQPERAGQNPDL